MIPFENISKLYNRKHLGLAGLPSLQLYLDGIERYHFGGTCYANNFHFYSLLSTLGYSVKLCAADMTNPDVHMVIMVNVDGREYLVDGGYGAPFLSPMPRDLANDYVVELGRDRYVLKTQDDHGRSRLELYRDGQQKHGYVAKPEATEDRGVSPGDCRIFPAGRDFSELPAADAVLFGPGGDDPQLDVSRIAGKRIDGSISCAVATNSSLRWRNILRCRGPLWPTSSTNSETCRTRGLEIPRQRSFFRNCPITGLASNGYGARKSVDNAV